MWQNLRNQPAASGISLFLHKDFFSSAKEGPDGMRKRQNLLQRVTKLKSRKGVGRDFLPCFHSTNLLVLVPPVAVIRKQ